MWQVQKKKAVYWIRKHWNSKTRKINQQKNSLSILCFNFWSLQFKFNVHLSILIKLCCLIPFFFFFFVSPVQSQCPPQYINQALLLNSFFKSLIYISCCPWSEVCIILAFPTRPLAYFLIPSYSLQTRTNLHFLQFLQKVWVIRSRLYNASAHT